MWSRTRVGVSCAGGEVCVGGSFNLQVKWFLWRKGDSRKKGIFTPVLPINFLFGSYIIDNSNPSFRSFKNFLRHLYLEFQIFRVSFSYEETLSKSYPRHRHRNMYFIWGDVVLTFAFPCVVFAYCICTRTVNLDEVLYNSFPMRCLFMPAEAEHW